MRVKIIKLFIVGDFKSNTGPANVNKMFLNLKDKEEILFSLAESKIGRILELIVKILKSDYILFSGLSKLNLYGIFLSKILRKKNAYLMHGSVVIENKMNNRKNIRSVKIENDILKNVDKIICVSEFFKKVIDYTYKNYKEKTFYIYNPVRLNKNLNDIRKRDDKLILCVGGGIPIKNIKYVCKAVDLIDDELKVLVIGKKDEDTEEISKYKFVNIIEEVSSNEMEEYYKKAKLYIHNSSFESFGLAPLEAIIFGCDLLVSKNVGANEIIKDLKSEDIIYNPKDIDKISKKILRILKEGNNKRLINSISFDEISVETAIYRIKKIVSKEI